MYKVLNGVKSFLSDGSFRSKSLIIGGLPLIIFLGICSINLNLAEKITNYGKDFALTYFGSTWILMVVGICIVGLFLGFLFSKHRQEEPSYLLSLDRIKGLKNSWTLLVLLIAPLTFIYNVFVWSGYAFVVIANFIAYLIKSIYDLLVKYLLIHIWNAIKWLFNAIIWLFLNIIWMFTQKYQNI